MRLTEPMEIGLVFWAEQDAATTIQQLRAFDLHAGQLGVPPQLECNSAIDEWIRSFDEHEVCITSAVCSYLGEDYSSLDAVHKTVGFTQEAMRSDRSRRTEVVSRFAAALSIPAVSCHIGFIPDSPHEVLYGELCDLVKSFCDLCGVNGQDFVLETGQECAQVLLSFIQSINRTNLKVNFDPANMIMYGSGDPVAALKILSPHVLSVHCKDAHSPVLSTGRFGLECTLGSGEVDFLGFLEQLKTMEYGGVLSIEREEPDVETRSKDIEIGLLRLKQWKTSLGL